MLGFFGRSWVMAGSLVFWCLFQAAASFKKEGQQVESMLQVNDFFKVNRCELGTVICFGYIRLVCGYCSVNQELPWFFPIKLQTQTLSFVTQGWGAVSEQSFSLAHCTHSHQVAKRSGFLERRSCQISLDLDLDCVIVALSACVDFSLVSTGKANLLALLATLSTYKGSLYCFFSWHATCEYVWYAAVGTSNAQLNLTMNSSTAEGQDLVYSAMWLSSLLAAVSLVTSSIGCRWLKDVSTSETISQIDLR